MSTYNITDIKTELLNFVRSVDVVSTSDRGVTTTTQDFSGDGSSNQIITPTNTTFRNVRSLTEDGAGVLKYGSGYTVNLKTGTITIVGTSVSGTDNYHVQYDYGSDKIFDDFPKTNLSSEDVDKHVGFDIIDESGKQIGIGGDSDLTNMLIQFSIFGIQRSEIETITYNIRDAIRSNRRNFFYYPLINPIGKNNLANPPLPGDKTLKMNLDFEIPFVFELG